MLRKLATLVIPYKCYMTHVLMPAVWSRDDVAPRAPSESHVMAIRDTQLGANILATGHIYIYIYIF